MAPISLANYHLIAGVIAGFVAWRVRGASASIALGLAVLWLLEFAVG